MIRTTQELDLPARRGGPLASRSLYYERCHRRIPPERNRVSVVLLYVHMAWKMIDKEYFRIVKETISLYSGYSLKSICKNHTRHDLNF
jgi:hypothetical protein